MPTLDWSRCTIRGERIRPRQWIASGGPGCWKPPRSAGVRASGARPMECSWPRGLRSRGLMWSMSGMTLGQYGPRTPP